MSEIKEKIDWLLKYCSEYPGHEFMYDERLDDANAFNIDLGVEKYIMENINDVNFILLTGDAGDGKSRILFNLKEKLDNAWIVVNDFSEFDKIKQKEYIERIFNAIKNKKEKYIIAGNSGIFINAVVQFKYELFNKLRNRERCLVLNFKNRNLAKLEKTFLRIVKEFINYDDYEKCTECKISENCPFKYNLEKLNSRQTIEHIRILFDALFLMGIHVTFRDLLSLISYFITKGKDCNEVQGSKSIEDDRFYNNIFCYKGYGNSILSELSKLDIAKKDIHDFDYKNYHNNCIADDIGPEFFYYDKLEKLKILKREYFFLKPHELLNEEDSIYSVLPVEFLYEFKLLISNIQKNGYIDSMDSDNDILRRFELGLNKISNPNHSNAQLVLFDSPPITSKNVRIEYSSGQQLRLIFCTPEFYFTNGEYSSKRQNELEDLNVFYCFVYDEDEIFQNCPTIKINYDLFKQIMLAEKNIFTDKNAKLSNNVHLQSFTRTIFDKINSDYGVTITWTGAKPKDIVDFDISFIKPSVLDRSKSKSKKIAISSIGR